MAYIQVLFNGRVQQTVTLPKGPLTIGRTPDNQLQIDNQGVSSQHAVIQPENGTFFIEDKNSKNGTFVNGEKIDRKEIKYGDSISIFKHTLKFTAWIKEGEEKSKAKNDASLDTSETVVIDQETISQLIREKGNQKSTIVFSNGEKNSLENRSYTIGKEKNCDFKTKGFLAPSVSATLRHKEDGFYLEVTKKGEATINGNTATSSAQLKNGDLISIRNIEFEFFSS